MSKKKGNAADLAPSRKEKKGIGQYVLGFFLLLYTLFCFLPVLLVFIAAFTDEGAILNNGFSYFPEKWSLAGVQSVLKYGHQLLTSYAVTIFVTVFGTFLGLMVMSMFAYSISRKGFRLSKFLSIYLLIPMLFNGGQLSGYIIFTSYYHLKDSLWLLILPLCVSTMNVIILRTYIANSIPNELMEAAKIDGAGEYRTFFQITLPLLKPSMAAVGFMMATAYWNDWQNGLYYLTTRTDLFTIQNLLNRMIQEIQFLSSNIAVGQTADVASLPSTAVRMAIAVIGILPIAITYPFIQNNFAKGITLGAVKG